MEQKKRYEDLVFQYAYKNKINSEKAEGAFLKYLDSNRPSTPADYRDIDEKYQVLSLVEEATSHYMQKEDKKLQTLKTIQKGLMIAFYVFYLAAFFFFREWLNYAFIFILVNIGLSIYMAYYSNKHLRAKIQKEKGRNLQYVKRGIGRRGQKESFEYFVKWNYNENEKLFSSVIELSVFDNTVNSYFWYKALNKISKYLNNIFLIVILLPFLRNIKILQIGLSSMLVTVIVINLVRILTDSFLRWSIKDAIKANQTRFKNRG